MTQGRDDVTDFFLSVGVELSSFQQLAGQLCRLRAQGNLGRKSSPKATYLVHTPVQHEAVCIRYLVRCLTSFTVSVCFLVSHCDFSLCNFCVLPTCCLQGPLRPVLQAVRGWPLLLDGGSADSSSALWALVLSCKIHDEFAHLEEGGSVFISLLLFLTAIVHHKKRLTRRKHSHKVLIYFFVHATEPAISLLFQFFIAENLYSKEPFILLFNGSGNFRHNFIWIQENVVFLCEICRIIRQA